MPPTSTIACNDLGGESGCGSGWDTAPVSVALSATDNATETGAVSVALSATDNAGNAEAVNTQLIRIDTTAPTVAITAPANGVTASVKVTASAADTGSWVAKVTFYLDGKVLATVTSAPYSTQWNTKKSTKGTHTLTAVAQDNAGNTATSTAVTVTVANSSSPSAYQRAILGDTPLAYWRLGDPAGSTQAVDSSGNNTKT